MRLTIATWNINSVRLRQALVLRLLEEERPDILCLQETKTVDEKFPLAAFVEAGYPHALMRGQPSYNGVAILSRHPLEARPSIDFCGKGDCRHIAARVEAGGRTVDVHSLYTPSGGDEPDPDANDKFAHKLAFLDEMAEKLPADAAVVLGDFNVAPLETDVWSHKQMINVVSHTPVEVEKLERAQNAGRWIDVSRRFTPADQKLFSWWSYRARDWEASDRGRRLDHIWASPDLDGALVGSHVVKAARGWEKPSDHAPVVAQFEF